MAVSIKSPAEVHARPPRAVLRTERKIGLLGSHNTSLTDCPWDDPSWELWGHASSRAWYKRELDAYFELHTKSRWSHVEKKGYGYLEWLKRNTTPIFMHERYPEIPASIKYPKARVLQEFSWLPRNYYANCTAWMIAYALMQGVTTLGLWGISYSSQSEYASQRACAEAWIFLAAAKGVRVVLPEQCNLLREPALLYGWESHDENGILRPEFHPKEFKPHEQIKKVLKPGEKPPVLEIPPEIREAVEEERRNVVRPDWAKNVGRKYAV